MQRSDRFFWSNELSFQYKFVIVLILSFFWSQTNADERESLSLSSDKKCNLTQGQQKLDILPGIGWDNLVNKERGLTINQEVHANCRMSTDGKLLIPDDVIVEPIKSSRIELSSEVFTHFTNYTSLTAYSMNTETGIKYHFAGVSGDFSMEKESVRNSENINKGLTVRSQLRHRMYAVHQLPDSTLHPKFLNRLLDIAAHLQRSNISDGYYFSSSQWNIKDSIKDEDDEVTKMVDVMRAAYLSDLIIRDFGTHTITSVEAGAVVAKLDSLSSSSRNMGNREIQILKLAASSSFASFFSMKADNVMENKDTEIQRYQSTISSSTILSHGGPSMKASEMNLSNWEHGIESNLVAIDRSGIPIYNLITPRALPELSETMAFKLSASIKAAVERYYAANSVIGCLDPHSPFFDMDANVAADRCDEMDDNNFENVTETQRLPFGGVYENCSGPIDLCISRIQPNLATGKLSCPVGYISIQLLPPQVRACGSKCSPGNVFQNPECTQECAITTAFWCAMDPSTVDSENPQDLGFLFGGLFTDSSVNPITNSQSCPMYYEVLLVGRRLSICVSTDREFGKRFAYPFGGFYACQSGNPLTGLLSKGFNRKSLLQYYKKMKLKMITQNRGNSVVLNDTNVVNSIWPKLCPSGYTSHLAAVEDICQVNYCIPANSIKTAKERHLKSPPFIQLPKILRDQLRMQVQSTPNEPLKLYNSDGSVYKLRRGVWIEDVPDPNPNVYSSFAWTIVGGAVVLLLVGIVALPVVIYRRRRVKRARSVIPIKITDPSV